MRKEKSPCRTFESFGFEQQGETGEEVYGSCVFCDKNGHFYINKKTILWNCKRCGREGNLVSFLSQIATYHRRRTRSKHLKRLEELRGIPWRAFARWGVAYDEDREQYLLPCFSESGTVRDIRRWDPKKKTMRSTPGCSAQLYGLSDVVASESRDVYICEGEWDAIAFSEMVEDPVVAVPGAGTFKDEWLPFFQDKNVALMYDNDDAGRKGMERAQKKLEPFVKSVQKIEWENDIEGYDIRDWLIENEWNVDVESITDKRVYHGGESISLDDVKNKFSQHIYLSDDLSLALDIMYAHALANDIEGDPLWSYIVGPPGCGKTMLLMSLSQCEDCIIQSDLTSRSLVSGFYMKSGDPSYLPKWNRKCVIFKDFTEVLAATQQTKEELYGVLRGAYDGYVRRLFGNGVVREYNDIKFSLLAGVTPQIHADQRATMGERFLKYEIRVSNREEHVLAAIRTLSNPTNTTEALAETSARFLDGRDVDLPTPGRRVAERIAVLAQLIGCMRATVERADTVSDRLAHAPSVEVGTRLAKQLVRLGQFLCSVRDCRFDDGVYRSLVRVGMDSMIGFNLDILRTLVKGEKKTIVDLTKETGIPRTTLQRNLDDMQLIGVIRVEKEVREGRGRPSNVYGLNEWVGEMWRKAQCY